MQAVRHANTLRVMPMVFRSFCDSADFGAISDFLYSLYRVDNFDGNWLQPIWEYAYTHPWFDDAAVERIGIWESDGAIVAVAMYELSLGEAFFQVRDGFAHLKPEMLDHAEARLCAVDATGKRTLKAYVHSLDPGFERIVRERGYSEDAPSRRPMAQLIIPECSPSMALPPGFVLRSAEDNNDLARMDRALWRGFNHPGEPPPDGVEGRRRMQSGPHFRKDLTMHVEAPNGDFVAFAGLWFEPVNRYAYVEPVATDPDYRRMGLGRAAVLEGIRRCGELGARVAYVGSNQAFYQSLGFKVLHALNCWVKGA